MRTRWLANILTLLVLAATGGMIVLSLLIFLNPATALNPYPPPSPSPSPIATPTPRSPVTMPAHSATPLPSIPPTLGPSPTPLRPSPPTPTAEAIFPFSATVMLGTESPLLDCEGGLLIGTVVDMEGEDLEGYPIHVWGPNTDTIVLSGSDPAFGPSGWTVPLDGAEEQGGIWFVQLHLYNIYRSHPPLSGIVAVALPPRCPQAAIHFRGDLTTDDGQ